MIIEPKNISTADLHSHLLAAVAPRPIAFASTIDKEGNVNLSPYSFFNVFSSNPPIAILSPNRRVRDNTTKHTLENVKEHPEIVINVVNYNMVQQTSLSSTEYPKGVNEFIKAGFTEETSLKVKPPRVKESPFAMECKVREVIELGNQGGAGNLIICEILAIRINKDVLDEQGKIDQHKIDLVGRLGGNWYVRSSGDALFEVEKPLTTLGIGIDTIPADIRQSNILTGNHLGQLGNVEKIVNIDEAKEALQAGLLEEIAEKYGYSVGEIPLKSHEVAALLLNENRVEDAWKVLIGTK